MIINLATIILGLLASLYLFWRLPILAGIPGPENFSVSIIIPARNEAQTLPLLLKDLKNQTIQPLEIICVNDGSKDQTRQIIMEAGGRVVLADVIDKPKDWMGKAWACQKGAEQAKGQQLLFIDSDVRLASDGLAKLLATYEKVGCTVSVHPYHSISKIYEQLSLFFNLVEIGANGTGMPKKNKTVGLYGPVILLSRHDYDEIGGHRVAQRTIVDDLALGDALTRAGKKYSLFLGGNDISYRMYGGGVESLFQGWTKNFATGAGKTTIGMILLTFIWITSCTATPLYGLQALLNNQFELALTYLVFYGIWVAELNRIVTKIGNFSRAVLLVYPIFLLAFLVTFLWSLSKKLFRRQVTWKGRKMKPEA